VTKTLQLNPDEGPQHVIGLGLQFAALGALAHQKAKASGIGREIPTDWLLENEHP